MGAVYKKTATKPLPAGAEIFERKGERFARWVDAKGKKRTAPLTTGKDGSDRIVITSGTYIAKYRDGSGNVLEVATGCRDADAARAVLGDLERRAELVKAGVMTATEDKIADHQSTALVDHITAYIAHQNAKALNAVRVRNTEARLKRLSEECGFARLGDLSAEPLERWLVAQKTAKMSPGNRNEFRSELVGFANWCIRTNRLTSNPFETVAKALAKADPRRKRRAMTEDELMRLLEVARWRPLAEYGRERVNRDQEEKLEAGHKAKRSNWTYEPLKLQNIEAAIARARKRLAKNPAFLSKLDRLGRERQLIYKAFLLTGLRLNELRTLTVGQIQLDGGLPCIVLNAGNEKNRNGSTLPLRADLAADLQAWLDDQVKPSYEEIGRTTIPFGKTSKRSQEGETGDNPLFTVPAGLLRILNRDLLMAGIPKKDDRGRTIDIHALRGTFATMLSKGGVSPRTAQAAMRHSSIDLTMNTYTDPRLLDVYGAMDALPSMSLAGGASPETVKATGTYDLTASQFAPAFALTPVERVQTGAFAAISTTMTGMENETQSFAISGYPVKAKDPLTNDANGSPEVEAAEHE